jgi:hypothetical protein
MADPDKFTHREQRFIEALRQAALSNYPNPDRVGCPDQKTLEAVARRQVPLMDPVIDHVWQCSPCAQEVTRLRGAASRKKRYWVAAGAMAAAIAVVSIALVRQNPVSESVATKASPPPASAPSPSPVVAQASTATLDLRPFSPTRGAEKKTATALQLKRANVALTLYLPVGLEEGRYDLRVMDDQFQTRLTQTVSATFSDHIVKIDTNLDLTNLSVGRYVLALRPAGENWRTFPLIVKEQ